MDGSSFRVARLFPTVYLRFIHATHTCRQKYLEADPYDSTRVARADTPLSDALTWHSRISECQVLQAS